MNTAAGQPLVSIVVPMFNAGATIERCIASLTAGGLGPRDWECLVVNDGSDDEGPGIACAYAGRCPGIRVIHQPNRGLPAARNAGIDHARGQWLRFLDADDWVTEGGLAALLDTACRADTPAACGAARYVNEAGEDLGWSFRPGVERVTPAMLVESHRFQVSASMLRKDALGDLRFADDACGSEDLDLWLRLGRLRAVTWAATQRDVCAYRLRPAGMSRDHVMMARVAWRVVSHAIDSGVPGVHAPAARARCLRRIALERATALAVSNTDGAFALWRELTADRCMPRAITPIEAAAAAHWSAPYAVCLPPTAWRDDAPARPLARALSRWWDLLQRSGDGEAMLEPRAVSALAGLITDPDTVAREIARRLRAADVRRAVLHGAGRNARALAPVLAGAGLDLAALDDALTPGGSVSLEGAAVRILDPRSNAVRFDDPGTAHVLTPTAAPALESRFDALRQAGPCRIAFKWSEVCADVSGREHQRLAALWPRPIGAAFDGALTRASVQSGTEVAA